MTNKERKKQWLDYTKAMAFYLAGAMKFAYSLPDDDNEVNTSDDTENPPSQLPPPPQPPQP